MKINYCPQCGGDVTSHYNTHVFMASYNEFYCKECFLSFQIEEGEIPEEALDAMGYCHECECWKCECDTDEEE